jgi:hypothetical protein
MSTFLTIGDMGTSCHKSRASSGPQTDKPNRGCARIYKAVERLAVNVAQSAADTAPVKATTKKAPAKPRPRHTKRTKVDSSAPRDGSKKSEVVELMSRKSGATLDEIMQLTGWQAHTVRGFVSGTLIKKMGLKVESLRSEEKGRFYRIVR